jgi:hypothetical protein
MRPYSIPKYLYQAHSFHFHRFTGVLSQCVLIWATFDWCQLESDMREDSSQYIADNKHALISSSAVSACSVEPGSATDIGVIVRRLLSYFLVLAHCLVRIVTYLGIHSHAFRSEGRWPCFQPWILLDLWHPDFHDALQ